jgi:hypothetical protein
MSPVVKRAARSDSFIHTPPGTYDRKKTKTGSIPYDGRGLPRLPEKRKANPRALAVKYRPIGGGMIHLQKLHQGKLSLRKSNNHKEMLGKVATLSKDLTDIVKTLTYDGNIDKEAYDKLSMDDKATFDDLLNKTGLVYTQKDWMDPKEALLEEYQKLAGEVAIQGKDANPEIKTELRRVIISMLACGLTSERKVIELLSML